jgi:hypothetical protein
MDLSNMKMVIYILKTQKGNGKYTMVKMSKLTRMGVALLEGF